jgi:hypothetical protein
MTEGEVIPVEPESVPPKDASAETIKALTAEINKLKKDLQTEKAKTNSVEKSVLLEKIKEGGFDVETFKKLDIDSLKATVSALATTSDKIKLNKGKDKVEEKYTGPTVFDEKTGKRKPFYS